MPESINYQQRDYVEKRVRYFDGQYLKVQDFVEEQQYHIDRQRRHNRFLYVSGIADGLKVEAKANSLVVTISPGTAIDQDGRQILLNRSFSFNNEEFPKLGETSSKNPGAELDLQLYKDKGKYDLFIVYDERDTDVQKQEGSENSTRFHERPKIELSKQQDYKGIKLATLNIQADKVDIDNSVRQYSGLRLPGAGNSEITLRYEGDTISKLAVLDGNLSVTGNVGIGTTTPTAKLEVSGGDLKVSGNLNVTGTSTLTGNVTANGSLSVTGNVGIGIASPNAKLEVVGTVKATKFQGDGSDLTGIVKKAGDTITGNLEIIDTLKITTDDKGITFFGDAKIFKKSGSGLKIQAHDDTHGIEFLKRDGLTSMMLLKDGNVGIGTTSPSQKLEVAGTVKATKFQGDGSELTGIVKDILIIHGTVKHQGSITTGAKFFTVQLIGNGIYDIILNNEYSFSDRPTVVVTQHFNSSDPFNIDADNMEAKGGNTKDNATVIAVAKNKFRVKCGDGDGNGANRAFEFIAIGPK